MFNQLKNRSEFSQNVLTLMTGTTLSQAIPIAISPILTRIYKPEDFGIYAIFVAIITILGSVVSGRYELAIMLPKSDEEAINIFSLGIIITLSMTLLTTMLVIIFNDSIIIMLNNQVMKFWLYLVPVSILLSGCHNLLIYFNNRLKDFNRLSNALIIRSSASAFVQLTVGFVKQGSAGLICGQIFSHFVADLKLSMIIIRNRILIREINKTKIIEVAKRFKNFPMVYSNILSISFPTSGSPLDAKVTNSTFPSALSMIFLKRSNFIVPINPFFLLVNVLSVSKQNTHL